MPSYCATSTTEGHDLAQSSSHPPSEQNKSPLLGLPAELRNIIYVHTLGGNTWTIDLCRTTSHVSNPIKYAFALLQVNHQVYSEAHLFPYLYNIFETRHNGHLREWIKSLREPHRNSITCIKRYQRSYMIETANGVEVSPIFWMDAPKMGQWELNGLKRLEVEVVLCKWGWDTNEEETKVAKADALAKLMILIEAEHPGVAVNIVERNLY